MKLPVKVEKRPLDPETAAYANEVADRLRTTLGDDLVGVYLHGSAVLGDFSRDHSDIDIVAVTEDSLSDDQKRAIAEQLSSTSLPLPVHELEFHLVRRQSISGTVDAPAFELHLTNGASNRVVDGEGHHGDPDLVMHFAVLAEHGQALLGPPASQIFPRVGRERLIRAFARELKWAKEHASPSYQVLNAARAWQFLETGAIASKLEGGAWAGGHVRDTSTIDAALQHRRGMTDSEPDPEQAGAFLDDVLGRLTAAGDTANDVTLGARREVAAERIKRIPKGLIALIGTPGAGKTVFASELIRAGKIAPNAVISSDSIGEELFGPDCGSSHDPEIFAERDKRIRQRLAEGKAVIADSTNVTPEARQRLLAIAREAGVPASALRMEVSVETAFRQDQDRDKHVEEIERYHGLMVQTASPAALKAEGFEVVFDVPGADHGITPSQAARRFEVDSSSVAGTSL